MGSLAPIAFDIETSGFDPSAVITVAGLAHEVGEVIILNTDDKPADEDQLEAQLTPHSAGRIDLYTCPDEHTLLSRLGDIADTHIDSDGHYLTAYHGETWNGGFDLPFLRTACVKHDIAWPFPDMAYADTFNVIDRFDTNDSQDLVSVYDHLIDRDTCDPFDDSAAAVDAFTTGDWEPLLLHNLADIQRTRELAALASEYVAKSDFNMKNLSPPA